MKKEGVFMKKKRKTLSILLACSLLLGTFSPMPFGFAFPEKVQPGCKSLPALSPAPAGRKGTILHGN